MRLACSRPSIRCVRWSASSAMTSRLSCIVARSQSASSRRKRLGIALDQGHRRLELVGNHRNKGRFELLRLAEAGDVDHVEDGAHQLALVVVQGGDGDPHADRRADCGALRPLRRRSAPLRLRCELLRRHGQGDGLALPVAQGQNLRDWAPQGGLGVPTGDVHQRAVKHLDPSAAVQDQHALGAVVDDGRQRIDARR